MAGPKNYSTTASDFLEARVGELVDPEIVSMLRHLCDLYAERRLLPDGHDVALSEACCNSPACWNGDTPAADRLAHSGIAAPWIGPGYKHARICIVGMNHDRWGGLDANWTVCRSHIEALERGKKGGKGGHFFAYGIAAYASLLVDSLRGQTHAPDWRAPEPQRLARVWEACSFLEAIKCSPNVKRGTPTRPMMERCPRFLLQQELEVLNPSVVLLVGRTKGGLRDVVRPMLNFEWGTHPPGLERDTFRLSGNTRVDLITCNHPSARNSNHWRRSLFSLAESLADEPLAPAGR